MALGQGTTTSDTSLGPGYTPQGSFSAGVGPVTASTTNGITLAVGSWVLADSPNVPPSKVGG